jgi:CBS domain-containing protein
MPYTVRDWMSSPVVVVDHDSSVTYALTLMRRRHIHSVVVINADRSYGIITTTDIRDKIVGEGRNPAETTVGSIMSGPLILAKPEWTLVECSQVMQKHHIHHLPVQDESGALVGLISVTDIFMAVEESGWQTGEDE